MEGCMKKIILALIISIWPTYLFGTMPVIDGSSILQGIINAMDAYEQAIAQYNQFYQQAQMFEKVYQGLSDSLLEKNENWFNSLVASAEQGMNVYNDIDNTFRTAGESLDNFGSLWGSDSESLQDAIQQLKSGKDSLNSFLDDMVSIGAKSKEVLGFGIDFNSSSQVGLEGLKQMSAGLDTLTQMQRATAEQQAIDAQINELEEKMRIEESIREVTAPVMGVYDGTWDFSRILGN